MTVKKPRASSWSVTPPSALAERRSIRRADRASDRPRSHCDGAASGERIATRATACTPAPLPRVRRQKHSPIQKERPEGLRLVELDDCEEAMRLVVERGPSQSAERWSIRRVAILDYRTRAR